MNLFKITSSVTGDHCIGPSIHGASLTASQLTKELPLSDWCVYRVKDYEAHEDRKTTFGTSMQFQLQYLFQQVLHFPLPALPGAAQFLLLALCQLRESWGLVLLVLLFQLLTQFLALLPTKQKTEICQRLAKACYQLSMTCNIKNIIRSIDFFLEKWE